MKAGYKGAGCLVIYYDEATHKVYVLLGKRVSGVGAGTWSIPGGGWETKDGPINSRTSFRNTARRELFEEVGINVRPDYNMLKVWEARYTPFFEYYVYVVRLVKRVKITRWSEFSKVGWFDVTKLPKKIFWMVPDQIKHLLNTMKEKGYQID